MKRGLTILLLLLLTGLLVWAGGWLSYTPWVSGFSPGMEYFYESLVGLGAGLAAGRALRRQLAPSKAAGDGLRWMAAALFLLGILPFFPLPSVLHIGYLLRYRILLFGLGGLFLGESL